MIFLIYLGCLFLVLKNFLVLLKKFFRVWLCFSWFVFEVVDMEVEKLWIIISFSFLVCF